MRSERRVETDALFERLFLSYQQPVLNYLYRLVGDAARAEELTQEAFVRAYRALPRLDADANHRAWLYRIATNAAYDYLRRQRLVQWLPLVDNDRPSPRRDDHENTTDEQEEVRHTLAQLPPNYRVPLILYSIEGYTTGEIGEILGISAGAVKTRLFRARERFRELYGRGELT